MRGLETLGGWRGGPAWLSDLGRGQPQTRFPSTQISAPGSSGLSIYDNWIRYYNRSSSVYGLVPR